MNPCVRLTGHLIWRNSTPLSQTVPVRFREETPDKMLIENSGGQQDFK